MTDQIERIRQAHEQDVRTLPWGLRRTQDFEAAHIDRGCLLAEVDRLNAEIDAWRVQWKASQAEIARLERIVAGMT